MNPAARDFVPRAICSLVLMLSLATVARAPSDPPVNEVVRRDWYFRESLVAIDDWETILARWESQTAERERTPTFPVPSNGVAGTWPNPVPATLLPERDCLTKVRLRVAGGSVELERIGPDGDRNRQSVRDGEIVRGYQHPGGGGSSRWYHRYHRRFDTLTAFHPRAAPFAIEVTAPADFQLGDNEFALEGIKGTQLNSHTQSNS